MGRYIPPHKRPQEPKHVQRKKVLVVPYIEDPTTGDKHMIFFLDTDSKEWTLISGGCGMRDQTPLKCADRELREESNNALCFSARVIPKDTIQSFSFETKFRVPTHKQKDREENIDVTSLYHVFLAPVHIPFEQVSEKYYTSPSRNGETSGVTTFSYDMLKHASPQALKKMGFWHFILDDCLPRIQEYLS